jgi:hypothetical protein
MAPDLEHWWAVPMLAVVAAAHWKQLSLALMRLLAVLGPTDRIRRHAFEVIRLDRADVAEIPSYLAAPRSSVIADPCHGEQGQDHAQPKGGEAAT